VRNTRKKVSLGAALFALLIAITAVRADVFDVNPDGLPAEPRFGGRSLGITIHPTNANIVYLASEQGGFFSSTNGGSNWTHIDAIPVPIARDILIDPQDANIIIASGRYDGRIPNQGGIWRSADSGLTWAKPATSNPACSNEASTWGIAIPNNAAFDQFVYVATDCGVAISNDSGATWNHVDPCTAANAAWCNNASTYFDVEARVVGGQVQIDVCGDEGFFRSVDGGANWSAPDPNSPARRVAGGAFNPCNIATAPGDANTVYLANYSGLTPPPVQFCISRLMESAAGGGAGTWTNMQVTASNCRDPWVVTHPDQGGNANRFEVYFGDTQRMRRQLCDATTTPRCLTGMANWPTADTGSHSDTSDIAFDTAVANGCPRVLTSDGGNAVSTDCGATWQDGNRGLHALDVVTFAGTRQAGGLTDLYAGTQDNGIYVTTDNATSWARPAGADVYNVLADSTPPARVFYRQCFGCSDFIANSGLGGAVAFTDPPGTIGTFAVATQFGPFSYAFVTSDAATPPNWTAWVTTNEGVNWAQLGPSPLPGNPGEIKSAGPAATPTFYLRLNVGGQRRMYRLTGALDNTATLALANAGLNFPSGAWDVDRSNPLLLYVSDVGLNRMMSSIDGGVTWNPDLPLTNSITQGGLFRFSSNTFGSQVTGVGIDDTSARIVVGTTTAGAFVSVTDGAAWLPVVGSQQITQATQFFFDQPNNDIYASTRGRGIWRIELPSADLTIDKTAAPDPAEKGETLTYTMAAGNDGPDPSDDVTITDALPVGIDFVSASATCANAANTVTCNLGDLANGATANVEIVGLVSCALPDGAVVTNTATITSATTPDEDLSDNESSADVTVFDTTPPVIESMSVAHTSLWPPNHKLASITATVVATDTCDPNPVCAIVDVASDEPVNGLGDGNTAPDWLLSGGLTAELRAERAGPEDGRVYTVTVECTDTSGNTSLPASADVSVAHDQRP
jgi:uncharacterized repeat protein (TIGR01451 family)